MKPVYNTYNEHYEGLLVNVYRSAGSDASMNGISSKFDNLVLINGMSTESLGPFNPKDDLSDALVLIERNVTSKSFLIAIPFNEYIETGSYGMYGMFGGNFVYSSDSRFPSDSPIKVFDRFEK